MSCGEARRAEDDLSKGEWARPKTADWPKVIELSSGALATKTKDLQVGAWLVEALVELYGFVGLRDGLKLMRGLHEQFWETLYPQMDEGDMDGRANAVSLMDARVELPLKRVSLTKSGAGADYSYIQWEESSKFDIPENIEGLDSEAQGRALALQEQAAAEENHRRCVAQAKTRRRAFSVAALNESGVGSGARQSNG